MNAKEKAKEIYENYYRVLFFVINNPERILYAKQCSIIAVKELIKLAQHPLLVVDYEFYNEVLTELERM